MLQVLTYYLNVYLGKYVEGLDPQSLKVSVWAGDVVLRNLRLRPEALKGLNLPITVRGGVLGTLRLKVCLHDHGACCNIWSVLRTWNMLLLLRPPSPPPPLWCLLPIATAHGLVADTPPYFA